MAKFKTQRCGQRLQGLPLTLGTLLGNLGTSYLINWDYVRCPYAVTTVVLTG